MNLSAGTGTCDAPLAALYAFSTINTTQLTNITAEITAPTTAKYVVAFKGFTNLTGCTAISDQSFSETGMNANDGFFGCSNLTSCRGICNVVLISGSTGNKVSRAFWNCNALFQCSASVTSKSATAAESDTAAPSGFYSCKFCTNCHVTTEGTENNAAATGFSNCNYLSNCNAQAKGNGKGVRVAFQNCNYLTNCQGETVGYTGSYNKRAFIYCYNLTLCNGISTSSEVPGFLNCEYVPYYTANMAGFANSYAGSSGSNAAANTQAGGWNRIV